MSPRRIFWMGGKVGSGSGAGSGSGSRFFFAICFYPSKDIRPRRTEGTDVIDPQGRASASGHLSVSTCPASQSWDIPVRSSLQAATASHSSTRLEVFSLTVSSKRSSSYSSPNSCTRAACPLWLQVVHMVPKIIGGGGDFWKTYKLDEALISCGLGAASYR
jgi:hypothetical protein